MESAAIVCTIVAAFASVVSIQSAIAGRIVWPWEFAAELHIVGGHAKALLANTLDRDILFMSVWLLPAGLRRIQLLPGPGSLLPAPPCSRLWRLLRGTIRVLAQPPGRFSAWPDRSSVCLREPF